MSTTLIIILIVVLIGIAAALFVLNKKKKGGAIMKTESSQPSQPQPAESVKNSDSDGFGSENNEN